VYGYVGGREREKGQGLLMRRRLAPAEVLCLPRTTQSVSAQRSPCAQFVTRDHEHWVKAPTATQQRRGRERLGVDSHW
jgi:hypothetical protein